MNEEQQKQIKKILCSKSGRKLLSCLLLVQPITVSELNKFGKLCFKLFKCSASFKNRYFPDISNIQAKDICSNDLEKYYKHFYKTSLIERLEKNLFSKSDIYRKSKTGRGEGILKKAINCNLVIEKKLLNERKTKERYYFLNSDIQFKINKDNITVGINTDSYLYKFKHNIVLDEDQHSYKDENISDRICINNPIPASKKNLVIRDNSNLFSLKDTLNTFWWIIKHQPLIKNTAIKYQEKLKKDNAFQRKDLPSEWRKKPYLLKYAFTKGIFYKSRNSLFLNPILADLLITDYSLSFCRSYEPLRCFSNFENHIKDMRSNSPMKLLDILISENNRIKPSKRPLIFSSIIAEIRRKIVQNQSTQYGKKSEEFMGVPEILIMRNSRVLKDTFEYIHKEYSYLYKMPEKPKKYLCYDFIHPI